MIIFSLTFIYAILKHTRGFKPIVLTDSVENTDLFPFTPVYATGAIRRYSWWWLMNSLHYRITDKTVFFEYMTYVTHILKQNRAQVIHAHFGPSGVKMLPVKQALRLPLVTTFYGYDMSELPRLPHWRRAYERLFDEGDLFLVEGPHMREALIELGCPADKAAVHHIGINVDRLTFRARSLEPDEKVIVLFCGRFTEKKGLIYALQALRQVVAAYPRIELRIIGDGEDRPVIEQYITDHRLEPYVTLLGYQPHGKFYEQLAKAHLFIQPSVTAANGDTEGGAPTVLLEAQACGVPVLATCHADIPEVVRDGESGFLVPERDAEALAEKWLDLLRSSDRWPEMGRMGRGYVEAGHNIQHLAVTLEDMYRTFL